MTIKYSKPGPQNMDQYLISGIPFTSSSVLLPTSVYEIPFPYVSKFISILNHGGSSTELAVGFSSRGVSTSSVNPVPANYFVVKGGTSYTVDIRCKTLFFSNSLGSNAVVQGPLGAEPAGAIRFSLLAGLTRIEAGEFPTITGSIAGENANSPTSRSFDGVG